MLQSVCNIHALGHAAVAWLECIVYACGFQRKCTLLVAAFVCQDSRSALLANVGVTKCQRTSLPRAPCCGRTCGRQMLARKLTARRGSTTRTSCACVSAFSVLPAARPGLPASPPRGNGNCSGPSLCFFLEKKTRPIDFSLGSDEGLDKLPTSPAGRTALKVRASVAMDAPAHVIGALACRGCGEGARQLQRQRHKW